ncbi:hypothetical protein [Mesorhizobium sp.]|uniref:hypothetical protein n=1 Tax=Mesorhizobium sp. TaxID=1871066 RepID=UPI000FE524DD|nr:hypothetical protein [Mesorhizobium sp.]RWA97586.1 MAG: hypothetical protein EOQ33_30715 [Mesorhizobium sp.]
MPAKVVDYIHNHPGSANLWYVRDIPEKLRDLLPPTKNGNQPTKWKISLRTAIRRDAPMARKLAAEHDAFIAGARAPDHMSNLTEAEREAIDSAGGVQKYLDWINRQASRAVQLADEADSWRDFADETSPSEAPDPDLLAINTAVMDAERLQIDRQLARDVSLVKALGNTPKKLHDAGLLVVKV